MDEPTDPETQLLLQVARGDSDAFARLYDRVVGLLYSVISRILNDPVEVDDAAQDALVLIWERAPTYNPRAGRPIPWMVALARNKAIDRLRSLQRRRRWVHRETDDDDHQEAPSPEPAAAAYDEDQTAMLRGAVRNLPGDQRTAIELAFFEGLTHCEIAGRLGQPLGTIKARIRRGMLKLRDTMEGRP